MTRATPRQAADIAHPKPGELINAGRRVVLDIGIASTCPANGKPACDFTVIIVSETR